MAKLPNVDRAIIDPRKLTEYLLAHGHRVGGPKADFLARFGFRPSAPEVLVVALMGHAASYEVDAVVPASYGIKYEICGPLACPDGRMPRVRSVWIILHGESLPRFVTAVPD